MKGDRHGEWIVAEIVAAHPWPWAWLVRVDRPTMQARVSVHSLPVFDAT